MDTLVMKHFLSGFSDEDAKLILKHCREVLPKEANILLLQVQIQIATHGCEGLVIFWHVSDDTETVVFGSMNARPLLNSLASYSEGLNLHACRRSSQRLVTSRTTIARTASPQVRFPDIFLLTVVCPCADYAP